MKSTLSPENLAGYVARQLELFFPDGEIKASAIAPYVEAASERAEHCFRHIRDRYHFDGHDTLFNHRNTDQYACYLYFLCNTIHRRQGDSSLAEKVYGLNKALHGIDIFYEVELPDIFMLVHPVGTVLGRARYEDYLCVYQNCTVGANLDDEYPRLGRGVVLYGGSRIIGRSHIGDNCMIATGTIALDFQAPPDSVVFGQHPSVRCKRSRHNVIDMVFGQVR